MKKKENIQTILQAQQMMRFVPMQQVVGNDNIKKMLSNAIEKKMIAHAYLFAGPENIGKETMARAFAGRLLCENISNGWTCGCCHACKMLQADNHPDFYVIEPQGSSIKIEQIRKLQKVLDYKPFQQGWRIFIIKQAEKMTVQAANSFLKTLEEPPEENVFILLAKQPQLLLETVISRCQTYIFKPVSVKLIAAALQQQMSINQAQAEVYACLAGGCYGRAVQLAENPDSDLVRLQVAGWLEILPRSDTADVLELVETIGKLTLPAVDILDIIALWLRDILLCQYCADIELLSNRDSLDLIFKLVQIYSPDKLLAGLEAVEEAKNALRFNSNVKLTMELTLMKIA